MIVYIRAMSETPRKIDSEPCMFIEWLILSPHELNDYKLSEMIPNESLCVSNIEVIWINLESFGVF